jgi:hypothetical protein
MSLKDMLATSASYSMVTARSKIGTSSTERPPSTQFSTFLWVLDSRASFHMYFDSFVVSSL